MSGTSDRPLSPAERIAFNRVQLLRQQQAERNQFLDQNPQIERDSSINRDPVTGQSLPALREERAAAVEAATVRADQTLKANNSYVQSIPAASADPNDRTTLADRAIQEERAARAPTVSMGAGGSIISEGSTIPSVSTGAGGSIISEGSQETISSVLPAVGEGTTPTTSNPTTATNTARQAASATAAEGPPRSTTSTTSAPAAGAVTRVGGSSLQFEPNPHNQYDRVSYVFKLCMINDLDAEDPNLLSNFIDNKIRKIIIAESGVTTGFAIGDVEITDMISPNFRSRSNLTTDLRIQIMEPYSLTLPDRMYMASKELGTQNWRLAPFLLQLEFRYIKQDGSLYTPSGDQKLIKVYKLMITDFDAELTEVGTKYEIKASVIGNLGFRDAYQILPQSHRINTDQGANQPTDFKVAIGDNNTVGNFFTNLGNTISRMYRELRQNNITGARLPVLIYKFFVEPDLAKQIINFNPEANSRRASFRTGSANTAEITVSRGISVTALVDDILASLQDATFFLTTYELGGLVKIPVIECVTKNVGWDLITNDYVREFTFYIRMKLSNRPVPYQEHGTAIQESSILQQARLDAVTKTLKKSYDYFYTGLNTEIIRCDIKFNQLHIIPTPLVDVTPPMAPSSAQSVSPNDPLLTGTTPASINQNLTQRARERVQILGQLEQAKTSVSSTVVDEAGLAGVDALVAEYRRRQADVEERIQAIAKDSVVPFEGRQDIITWLNDITNNSEAGQRLRESITRTQLQNTARASQKTYAEDINTQISNNMLQLTYHADPRDVINSMARPTNIESQGGNNVTNSTRPMVSSILSQIYDRPGNQLLEIDLEIRGDPYWLGKTDLERAVELAGIFGSMTAAPPAGNTSPNTAPASAGTSSGTTTSSTSGPSIVDRNDQDANILLRFRAGSAPKEDTGFMNLSEGSTFFYGVYTVLEVIHEFRQGKFTQKLKANRDTLINVDQLRYAADTTSRAVSNTQPTQVTPVQPASVDSGQSAQTNSAVGANTNLQNPNANPANLARGTQESVVTVDNTQSPPSFTGSILGNSPENLARRQEQSAALRAQFNDLNNRDLNDNFARARAPGLLGDGGRGTSLTGEEGLRDPSNSLYEPRVRSLPNSGIPVYDPNSNTIAATYNAGNNTVGNTSAGPGQTVDYSGAELDALRAGRTTR